jgi:hypothetical protein
MLFPNYGLLLDSKGKRLCRCDSIQKIAAARLEDQLSAENVLRVFKAGLAAADIALCAACMSVVIEQLPVNRLEPPRPPAEEKEDKRRPVAGGRTPTALSRGTVHTPDRKPPTAGGKESPVARSTAAAASKSGGKTAPAAAEAVLSPPAPIDDPECTPIIDPEKLAAVQALERDIKDLVEVLKTFITRVMSSSSTDE